MSEIMNNGMNEIGSNGIKGNGTEEKKYRIERRLYWRKGSTY